MRRNFIQNYERNLVESAVKDAVMTLIEVIKDNDEELGYMIENNPSIRDKILQNTGVDIWQ